ncbi:hypothetical protein C5O97_18815 [Escherichia coli]|nr:hypothetical protein C5O97_18815 [Escherichia coli]
MNMMISYQELVRTFLSDDLFTKKAMNWRKTICPEGLSVPLLLPDCNNRYYSKYCLFHLRSCF